MREQRLHGWGEMLVSYLVLALICLVMVFGRLAGWLISVPVRLLRRVRR